MVQNQTSRIECVLGPRPSGSKHVVELEAVGVGATEVDGDECVGLEHVIKLEAIEIGG